MEQTSEEQGYVVLILERQISPMPTSRVLILVAQSFLKSMLQSWKH
ncbi:hypothetical protein AM1_5846 [Acaryochloris marina MBIC11017]|uniref:Uncharacterized protein n=1 Tax=Acaryochloris marina (strain MBIC 11017) TaxID=329726 RepID=B0C0J5_ACAM1|nr:hypothetical protein AM1_5846 [Acaryochloris marina MBIC11017]